ncbi:MAG: hypothetical protein ACTHU0_21740 [Kofleriaceae bacterium]
MSAKRKRIAGLGDGRTRESHTNTALSTKVDLRHWLLEQLAARGVAAPRILDCFCAGGQMWARAYGRPAQDRYLGIDLDLYRDERRTIVADSARFLRDVEFRAGEWDVYDLDAFGTPFEHLAVLGRRLGEAEIDPGRAFGFVLTDGTGFASRMSNMSRGLLRYVGVAQHACTSFQQDNRIAIEQMAIRRAMTEAGLDVVEHRVMAHKGRRPSAEMRYIALVALKRPG